jgi:putative pyruvate formate lyase activating enzyme
MTPSPNDRADRIRRAYALMTPACRLCPRECGADRRAGEVGHCATGWSPFVSSASPHFGEEDPLVGQGGSGTIFMSGCNLGCVFCQNFDISTARSGRELTVDGHSQMMTGLVQWGCHNVNFVTPTHQTPPIMEAIALARDRGMDVPVVYNCGGYESLETLALLEGFVDVYMPDVKFFAPASAERYCGAPDYPDVMADAIREMHRQVGDLEIQDGLAVRGLLVRHLVMPGGGSEGAALVDYLAGEISGNTYVNVMPQYRPMHKAYAFPEIARAPTHEEFLAVRDHAEARGLRLAR